MISKSHFKETAWYIGRLESNDGELMYRPFEITNIFSAKNYWRRKGFEITFLLEKPFFEESNCKAAVNYLNSELKTDAYKRLIKDIFPDIRKEESNE